MKALQDDPDMPEVTTLYYSKALRKRTLPAGTYIFTCLSVLGARERDEAARLYRRLQEAGCRVLNDPARVKTRYGLLRALHREGINPFNVYRADEEERPRRFPVFVRVAHGSQPPLTDLISDQSSLEQAIEAAVTSGYPREALVIVEYAAEPIREGVFRKSSVFRVGDHFIPDVWWYGKSWDVKGDHDGLADQELYDEELRLIRDNRYPSEARQAFELADIEHGRLDFGYVDGRACIYEINFVPAFYRPRSHPVPERAESLVRRWRKLQTAFHTIDSNEGDSSRLVDVKGTSLAALKQAKAAFPLLRPTPTALAREYERRGDLAAALDAAESAVSAHPNNARALSRLARLLQKSDRIDDAIAVSKRVLALSPRNTVERERLVAFLIEEDRFAEAQEQLEEAKGFGVDNPNLDRLRALANQQLEDNARAAPGRSPIGRQVRLDWLRRLLRTRS